MREGLQLLHYIEVGRLTVVKDMLKVYREYRDLCTKEIRVTFRNETGMDMGGLTTELFPLFWNSLESTHFDGNVEKVPILTPNLCQIFSHSARFYHTAMF